MIIRSIHIDHFGKWNDFQLQNLGAGVNLFYGPNEAGKTTLMQFLRAIFYGFSAERLAYTFQNSPEMTGGDVMVSTPYGDLNITRHLVPLQPQESLDGVKNLITKEATEKKRVSENEELPFFARESFRQNFQTRQLEDGLVITNTQGTRQDSFQWRSLIDLTAESGFAGNPLETNETLFNNIFALGLQELQQLSVLNSTEASRRLYDLSTGVTRYSLVNILNQTLQHRLNILREKEIPTSLNAEDLQWCGGLSAAMFLRETANSRRVLPHEITALISYSQILEKQREHIQSQNKQYGKIYTERSEIELKIRNLTEEIQQQKHKIHILETAQNVQDAWNERTNLDSQIVDFGKENPQYVEISDTSIDLLAETLQKLSKIKKEIQNLRESRSNLQEQITQLLQKKEGIHQNTELLQSITALESFFQQQEWIENLRGRLEDLHRQQLDSEAQLLIDYRRLGLQTPNFEELQTSEDVFPYDVRTLRPLRTPMREMKRIRLQMHAEKKKRAELLLQAESCTKELTVYFHAVEERSNRNPLVRNFPGMERFPKAFLISNEKANQASFPHESDSETKQKNALRAVNSSVINEIPSEILNHAVPQTLQKDSVKLYTNSQDLNESQKISSQKLMDVNAASAFLGEILAILRRSELHLSQLTQTLKNLGLARKELKETCRKQLLPMRETCILGSVFTFGLAFVLFELLRLVGLGTPSDSGVTRIFFHLFFMIFGLLLCVGTVTWRCVFAQKVEKKIETSKEVLDAALQQRSRLVRLYFTDREAEVLELTDPELTELCNKEAEKLNTQSTFLESELTEAEKMSLVVSRRDAVLLEAKHRSVRLHKLNSNYVQAQTRRIEVLKSLGLPENWKSSNIRLLMDASDRIRELWRRRSRDCEDFNLYAKELGLLVERLENLLPVFGTDFAQSVRGGDARFPFIPVIFTEMQRRIKEERTKEQAVKELNVKLAEYRSSLRKLKNEFEKKSQNRSKLLESADVTDEKSLAQKLKELQILKNLRAKRRELQKQIDAVVGFACTESMLWEVYENNTPEQLEERKKILINALTENEFQLESAQKRENECKQILEQIISDDSPARVQYEQMKTRAQIGHTVTSWRVFAMLQRLLETIQRTFQQKRQPWTLECASGFLREMTDGKYERVWTPVDENILFVQREDGTVFSTEQLSMGTRELLYLAIRLALIEEYRKRNIHLPLIFDDVLVNFDQNRAEAAVKVLTHFAGTQTQIFFFTSHPHIQEMFARENAFVYNVERKT